jgi:hypothetical protein
VRRSFRLRIYGYVVMPEGHSPSRLRAQANCPTQAKIGLEWATVLRKEREEREPSLSSWGH